MTDIEAHITGTVWKIECAVGDTVEEGDTVAILESMKMEMPVEAEDAGTVTEIRCEEGQSRQNGEALASLSRRGDDKPGDRSLADTNPATRTCRPLR